MPLHGRAAERFAAARYFPPVWPEVPTSLPCLPWVKGYSPRSGVSPGARTEGLGVTKVVGIFPNTRAAPR